MSFGAPVDDFGHDLGDLITRKPLGQVGADLGRGEVVQRQLCAKSLDLQLLLDSP
jgi:hypothetical protein